MSENGIATIQDLMSHGLHRVTLPGCEKPVVLKEPSPLSDLAYPEKFLPMSLAGHIMLPGMTPEEFSASMTPEERAESARTIVYKVCELFYDPPAELRFENGGWKEVPGKLNPLILPAAAQDWLLKFAQGRIDASGRSVEKFRNQPAVPGSGEGGPEVRAEAVGAAQG